ncbi:MAG: preprotein translocase subunit SecY [Candidatus Melainabacteria bacterium]|nr:preprotein translocase subunit SecY [Candidatus Melainabacteria bacterium]
MSTQARKIGKEAGISTFAEMFKASGLMQKLMFTVLMLAIYRLGVHIPLIGVNHDLLKRSNILTSGLLGLVDLFAGGALSALSIFALGIGPYITSSIIMQLMTEVIPALKNMQREQGDQGRKQFQQITRRTTVALAMVQSLALARFLDVTGVANAGTPAFYLNTVVVLTCSSIFVMWLGEVITESGIGNGASILIFIGIASRMPIMIKDTITALNTGSSPAWGVATLLLVFCILVILIIFIQEGARKILVLGARRQTVGGRVTSAPDHYMPFKINPAGVLPIIFASSLMFLPLQLLAFAGLQNKSISITLRDFFTNTPGFAQLSFALSQVKIQDNYIFSDLGNWLTLQIEYLFRSGHWQHSFIYFLLIMLFSYFYASIILNPREIAENLKKNGSAIQGVKPGKATSEYLDLIINRLIFIGAVAIGLVAVLPIHVEQLCQVSTLGGLGSTSLIILVGVAIDTRNQIITYAQTHRYQTRSILTSSFAKKPLL